MDAGRYTPGLVRAARRVWNPATGRFDVVPSVSASRSVRPPKAAKAQKAVGDSAGLAAHQITNLSYQPQDAAVQLAGGQNPLLILLLCRRLARSRYAETVQPALAAMPAGMPGTLVAASIAMWLAVPSEQRPSRGGCAYKTYKFQPVME